MAYDYSMLNGKIISKYKTHGAFARAMGFSITTESKKMNGKSDWRRPQIIKACSLLDIPIDEVDIYFFTTEVQSI